MDPIVVFMECARTAFVTAGHRYDNIHIEAFDDGEHIAVIECLRCHHTYTFDSDTTNITGGPSPLRCVNIACPSGVKSTAN